MPQNGLSTSSRSGQSHDQLNELLEALKVNPELQKQLRGAVNTEAATAIAQAAGFSIDANDLKAIQTELTEAELESMAGGGSTFCPSQVEVNCK